MSKRDHRAIVIIAATVWASLLVLMLLAPPEAVNAVLAFLFKLVPLPWPLDVLLVYASITLLPSGVVYLGLRAALKLRSASMRAAERREMRKQDAFLRSAFPRPPQPPEQKQ